MQAEVRLSDCCIVCNHCGPTVSVASKWKCSGTTHQALPCVCSALTEAKLSERLAVGNRILQLIALCRKYEGGESRAGVPNSFLDNPQIQGLRDTNPMLVAPHKSQQTCQSSMDAKQAHAVNKMPERESLAGSKENSLIEDADHSWKIRAGREAGEGERLLADLLAIDPGPLGVASGNTADTISARTLTE